MSTQDILEGPGLEEPILADPPASVWTPIGTCAELAAQATYPIVGLRDGEVLVWGGDGANAVLSTRDGGVSWTKTVGDWAKRQTSSGAALDGQLYIVGGFGPVPGAPPPPFDDAWASDDGQRWAKFPGKLPWGPCWAHVVLPFRGHLMIIAGVNGYDGQYTSDVWALEPEGTWRKITTGQFKPRAWAAGAVLGRTLIVVGGWNDADGAFAECLVSKDAGLTWAINKTPFAGRHSASALTIGDTMYLVGGCTGRPGTTWHPEVWATKDGVLWTKVDNQVPLKACAAPLGGKIAVLGGAPDIQGLAPPPLGWSELTPSPRGIDTRSPNTGRLNGKFWAWGGVPGNNVYSSTDGRVWSLVAQARPMPRRDLMGGCVHHGKLFAAGGGANETSDVFASADGSSWTQVAGAQRFTPRVNACLVSFQGKLWVFSGPRDVWCSEDDGQSWTLKNPEAFPIWTSGVACVFLNQIRFIDGRDPAQVYSSADGVTWTARAMGIPPRSLIRAEVVGGTIYAMGGRSGAGIMQDVWASADAVSWTQVGSTLPYADLAQFGTIVDDNDAIIAFGGSKSQYSSDRILRYLPPQLPPA